jgi:hypothetical protein
MNEIFRINKNEIDAIQETCALLDITCEVVYESEDLMSVMVTYKYGWQIFNLGWIAATKHCTSKLEA